VYSSCSAAGTNYEDKGDTRFIVGSTQQECCVENTCTPLTAQEWIDLKCEISNPSSQTASGLGISHFTETKCIDKDGIILNKTQNDCINATWVIEAYKPCGVICTNNTFTVSSAPAECKRKTQTQWNILGCVVSSPSGDYYMSTAELGTITPRSGFNQCIISCRQHGTDFTVNSYEICQANERGTGTQCTMCDFGYTSEAGFLAGPEPSYCDEAAIDHFMKQDPEETPINFADKSSECQPKRMYARLEREGTLVCTQCGRESFLETYNLDAMGSTVPGTKHGICCQNSHHVVCKEMLKEYKLRCEYEDLDDRDEYKFLGSTYGKGRDGDSQCEELYAN
jgi:hypothetical protein